MKYSFIEREREREREPELTRKKSLVDPALSVPYWISVCLTRSSADSIGVNMRSTVRKAAKLAVYVDMIISVKNHQALPATRPETDLQTNNRIQ